MSRFVRAMVPIAGKGGSSSRTLADVGFERRFGPRREDGRRPFGACGALVSHDAE
jgi:hypothetical protein